MQVWQPLIGHKLGPTDWLLVDQQRINAFADATMDHQMIHVDAEAAATKAMGGTIAHGFLTLSLLSHMNAILMKPLTQGHTVLNYGLNRLRFIHPVKSGSQLRLHLEVLNAEQKTQGVLLTLKAEVQIENTEKPALVAEQLVLILDAEQG